MKRWMWAWVGAAVVGVGGGVAIAQDGAMPAVAEPEPYQRVVEEGDGAVLRLEMAVREFAPPSPERPKVFLAGAVHVGEKEFYEGLQRFLDRQDVVLFEGVKPAGAGAAAHDTSAETDEQKIAASKRRVRFVAMAVERYRGVHDGNLPQGFGELAEESEGRVASLLKGSLVDAWGHRLVYVLEYPADAESGAKPRRFDVVSLGADGKYGGEGVAADLKYSAQKPLSKSELGDRSKGIQQKLADALGVVFQLTAMDNNKANWRNSDLSVDQVQARLEKAGANADALFKMLDGSSFGGQLAGLLLGMMGSSPESRAMLRAAMIEMVAHADELLAAAPGGMGKMMGVLLEDRNAVVIEDLKKIISSEPGVKSVAIIYGAGHLPGMEKRIEAELGYKPVGDTWRTAMEVDAKAAGLKPEQVKAMRRMIGRSLEQQVKK